MNEEDYEFWLASYGDEVAPGTDADGNGNGVIDASDYVLWRMHHGTAGSGSGAFAVPEPSGMVLLAFASIVLAGRRRSSWTAAPGE